MYAAITFFAALTFVLSAFSLRLERIGVPPLVLATVAGVVVGPAVIGLIEPDILGIHEYAVLTEISRLVLTVSLLGVALRLPAGYWRANWRWVLASIGLGMLVMFAVSTGALVLLGIPVLSALLVAAAITPTDPVVTTPIVTGPLAESRIPERVRFNMSSESGLNDGLAFLFVMLPVLLLTRPAGEAWSHWALQVLVWEVGVPVVGGLVIGWGAGLLMDRAAARGWTMSSSYLGYGIALAVAIFGVFRLLDTDAIMAVFVAGAVFSDRITDDLRHDLGAEVDALGRVLVLPVFALIGLILPWQEWAGLGALMPVVLLLALVGRRIAGVWATRPVYRVLHTRSESAFLSWFGPVGVSALFYASIAAERTADPIVFPAVTMTIALSVLLHGLTATPAGLWLARRSEGAAAAGGSTSRRRPGSLRSSSGASQ
ncbi:cation:proton antiporter [Microbacterium sp. NPDC078428]|uniref:cation:proton antiporter domain-containing protein n=1 Tax=Microbacterium sp. NPDC078428 TaxID=3364190 RepID=UPI0037CC7A3B